MPFWRKAFVAAAAFGGIVALYEVTILDSKHASNEAVQSKGKPVAGARLRFTATAYCKGHTTASGVAVQKGSVAADADLLPAGSVVEINAPDGKYDGLYTILDTGPKIQGRILDIYMWSCHEALAFGRRQVDVRVLRLGWNPQAIAPSRSFLDRWFRRPRPAAAPAEPPPANAAPASEKSDGP